MLSGESPEELVTRLARNKAAALFRDFPLSLVIGSDQVAVCNNEILGKPGTQDRAFVQLQQLRSQNVTFLSGLCLLNTASGQEQLDCLSYHIHFRDYSDEEIQRYLEHEEPYNCAASFKSEALGISLVEAMDGPDPTALIGLPLLSLSKMLRREGLNIP